MTSNPALALLDPVSGRPPLKPPEAARIAAEIWGLEADASPLPGERDANFLLTSRSGERFVLKVSGAAEVPERVELQTAMPAHIRKRDPRLRTPRAVPARTGSPGPNGIAACRIRGRSHAARLLVHQDGVPLSAFPSPAPAILDAVGSFAGRLQRTLADFDHPGLRARDLPWAPQHGARVISAATGRIEGPARRALHARTADSVLPRLPALLALPQAPLHNDLNDDNLLLAAGAPESAGPEDLAVLDFGDALEGPAVVEVATAALYAAGASDEPLAAAAAVLAGFVRERPLSRAEAGAFRTALALRALVSGGIAAIRRAEVPGAAADPYLMTSEAAVWRVLAALDRESARESGARFLEAAGLAPPGAARAGGDDPRRLLARRRRWFSRALSISYDDPIPVVRGAGARLHDPDGRSYLDMVNNVCHVGHAHPRVAGAIARQAARVNTNTRFLYRELTDYAERLLATLPDPLEVVFFTNSGSESNDLALRIARNRLGRSATLVFDGAYHGNLTSLIEISPYKLDGPGGRPGPPWLHRLPLPDGFRGRFRAEAPDFPDAMIADARRRVAAAGPATLVSEAILGCGGQVVPPPGYLRALYRAVRDGGGLIVADEVQTGFGRVGPAFWAFVEAQRGPEAAEPPVVPDIVTLGKPAGNGHPLGAVVTTRELANSFETGMEYFNTYGGNPVSCAAGLAVLDVIESEDLAAHAERVGNRLLDGLNRLANRYPLIGEARGRGLFLGFELVRDPETRAPATAEARRLVNRLRQARILNSTDGPDANVIKIKPPLPFSAADADHYLEVLDRTLSTPE